jgi:spore coat protein JB
MNNNFYEIPNDWYSEMNGNLMNQIDSMNMPNMFNMGPNNQMNDLADPKVALDRGNLFNNLYSPYRNYKFRNLKPSNKREELLINILIYNFALTELEMYLDTNPGDTNMIGLYNKYLNNKKQLVMEYENNFGPLTLDAANKGNAWNWKNMPWPWEGTK